MVVVTSSGANQGPWPQQQRPAALLERRRRSEREARDRLQTAAPPHDCGVGMRVVAAAALRLLLSEISKILVPKYWDQESPIKPPLPAPKKKEQLPADRRSTAASCFSDRTPPDRGRRDDRHGEA